MKLKELLSGVEILELHADLEREITGVAYDSRHVKPGDLFVAITGFAADGHKYIPMALEKGAAAVLCERAPETGEYIVMADTRLGLAQVSCSWFDHPADKMTMIGVTGTNGKTTSTYLLKHILEDTMGAKVGLVGTIQNMIGDEVIHTERTTPESYELQELFRRMLDAGCTHVIMEVSSHALSLSRVAGVRFATGVFTNLTQDHLDFHKTMEEYRKAKSLLFSVCDTGVINADDEAATSGGDGIPDHLAYAKRGRAERIPFIARNKRYAGGLSHLHDGDTAYDAVGGGNRTSRRPRHLNLAQFAAEPGDKRLDRPFATIRKRTHNAFGIRQNPPYAVSRRTTRLDRTQASLERVYRYRNFHSVCPLDFL